MRLRWDARPAEQPQNPEWPPALVANGVLLNEGDGVGSPWAACYYAPGRNRDQSPTCRGLRVLCGEGPVGYYMSSVSSRVGNGTWLTATTKSGSPNGQYGLTYHGRSTSPG